MLTGKDSVKSKAVERYCWVKLSTESGPPASQQYRGTLNLPRNSINAVPNNPIGVQKVWKMVLDSFSGGGIRRRLLLWGLGLFGLALLVFVVAGYSYMARQIRRDAAALQSELAAVTAEQIRTFVRRNIELFSYTANALCLYDLGIK